MKILYLQYGNLWNPFCHGGLSRANHQILKRFAKSHDVTVYTGLIKGPQKSIKLDNVLYIQKSILSNRWVNRLSFSIFSFFVNLGKFDIVILIWDRYAPVIIRSSRYPTVLEIHSDFLNTPSKLKFIEPLAKFLFKCSVKSSKYAIVLTQYLSESIKIINNQMRDILVVPNGIDEEMPEYAKAHAPQNNYFLYIGRLDLPVKGVDVLLRAYKDSGVDLPLKIAGDGPDNKRIRDSIRELGLEKKVDLLGWVEGSQKYKWLNDCLALCLPSRAEGLPLAAIEALAFGKPVIGTTIPGLASVIQHDYNGLLFDTDDAETMAKHLKTIACDPSLRNRLSLNAKQSSKSYDWDTAAEKRINFFGGILKERHEQSSHQ